MRLDCLATDRKLSGDSASAVTCGNQTEDLQLTITQGTCAARFRWPINQPVHRKQAQLRADI